MASKDLNNSAGAWGATADVDSTIRYYTCATTLAQGDVVTFADATGVVVGKTTTANSTLVAGVVAGKNGNTMTSGDTWAAGDRVAVCTAGPCRVNIGANVVAAGGLIGSSTGSGVGAVTAVQGAVVAVALESQAAKDTNNCIRASVRLGA